VQDGWQAGQKLWAALQQSLPRRLDKVLRYLRYAVLAWVLWATASAGKLVFQDVDPYYALFNFWTGEVAISAFVILGAVLLSPLLWSGPSASTPAPTAPSRASSIFQDLRIKRNPATCIPARPATALPHEHRGDGQKTVRDHSASPAWNAQARPPARGFHRGARGRLYPSQAVSGGKEGTK
jgi:hypothetical protein